MEENQEKTYEFKVGMTCTGCQKALENVLQKNKDKGISNWEIDLKEQIVKITTTLPHTQIQEIVKKSGKTVDFIKCT